MLVYWEAAKLQADESELASSAPTEHQDRESSCELCGTFLVDETGRYCRYCETKILMQVDSQVKKVAHTPSTTSRASTSESRQRCHGCHLDLPIRVSGQDIHHLYCMTCFPRVQIPKSLNRKHRTRSPLENSLGKTLRSPTRKATRRDSPESSSSSEPIKLKKSRAKNVRCDQHRGDKGAYQEDIDACIGCRLCSVASKLYQRFEERGYKPLKRKNITVETKRLKRFKELELIAYLNGDGQCHQELKRHLGERYDDLMDKIELAGGLLPPLPWAR